MARLQPQAQVVVRHQPVRELTENMEEVGLIVLQWSFQLDDDRGVNPGSHLANRRNRAAHYSRPVDVLVAVVREGFVVRHLRQGLVDPREDSPH